MELSIIIVSFNTRKLLRDCLRSIYKYTDNLKFEVIVVDNNSLDGSADLVAQRFPQVKLIRSAENLGFGKANNLGAQKARGKFLLFLNSDTLIHDNAFKHALTQAETISELGAFTCRLLYEDGSIQPTGGYFPTLSRFFLWQLGLDDLPLLKNLIKPVHPGPKFYEHSFEPDWITGAFMLIPKKVFMDAKGFDPNIFMYGEDLELCYRLKQKQKKVIYSDFPSLTHLQSKSSSSQYALVNETKGISYFYQKHFPLLSSWVHPGFKLGALLRLVFFGIIMGNDNKKKAYTQILTQ